jgi:hypothetical protein
VTAFVPGVNKLGDRFLEKVAELQNDEDVNYLNSLFPHAQSNDKPLYADRIDSIKNGDFLSTMSAGGIQSRSEAYYYDAAIAIGLATCEAVSNKGISFPAKTISTI